MQKTFFLPFILAAITVVSFFIKPTIVVGQIEPPNYNFSLDTLGDFYPGKKLEAIKQKYGKGEVEFDKGTAKIYKFYVSHVRYKFPVFVNIFQGESVAFFARLPSYFLHDVFHQSLINRYGKQDEYSKVGNSANYTWMNKNNLKLIYQGQCTLTCFPMYLSGEMVSPPQGYPGTTDIMKEFGIQHYSNL